MNFSVHCFLLASFIITCNCSENNTDNNKTDDTSVPSYNGSIQQRPTAATGTNRNRDNTKLLSLLAARRKQMVQSRFNSHLATIAEIVETTTQLNKILGIQTSNISRIYIDARNIRHPEKRPSRIEVQLKTADTSKNDSDSENKTIEYSDKEDTDGEQNSEIIKTIDNNVNSQRIPEINKNYYSNPVQFKYVTNNPPKYILKSRKDVANSVESKLLDQKISNAAVSIQTEPIYESIPTDSPTDDSNRNAIINRNRKLPIDLDQISRDTYGLSEDRIRTDNYESSGSDDLLEVNESNHGLYVLNFVEKNSTSSSYRNETDSVEYETTTIDVQTNNVNYSLDEFEPTKETNISGSFDEENVDNRKDATEDTINFDREKTTNTTHFMPESLYNYFRPLEMNLPAEEIQPFLHFGQKIGVTKPNLTRNQIYKVQSNRPNYRSHNNQATVSSRNIENSEQSLMDLSVERQNIANKVVNLRSVTPTRHIDGARGYFRSRNYTNKISSFKNNNTRLNPDQITTENRIVNETRNGFNLRINKESGNKYEIPATKLNDTRTESIPNIQKNRIHRLRESYLSNPNRAYFILSKRNNTLRQYRDNNNNTESIKHTLDEVSRKLLPSNSQLLVNQSSNLDETESVITKRHDISENLQNKSENTNVSNSQQNLTVTTGNTPVLTTRILSTNVVTSVSVKSNGRKDALIVNTTVSDKNDTNINNTEKEVRTTTRFQIIVPDIEVTTSEMQVEETTISVLPQIPEVSQTNLTTTTTTTEKTSSTTENRTLRPVPTTTRKPELITRIENVSKSPISTQQPTIFVPKVIETDWSSIFSEPKVTSAPKIQITSSTTTSTTLPTTSSTTSTTTQIPSSSASTSEIPSIIFSSTSVPFINIRISTTEAKLSSTASSTISSSTLKPANVVTEAISEISSTNPPRTTPKPITFKSWLTTIRPRYTTPEIKTKTPSNIFYDQSVNKKQFNSTHIPETVILRRNNTQIENSNVAAYVLAAMGILPIAVIILLVIRNVLHNRMKGIDGESDILAESMPEREKHTPINPVAKLPMLVTDTNSIWEFPRSKLRLKTLLGEGNFGQVWKAEADDLKDHDGLTRLVAVKTIKDGAGAKEREDLYRELSIMQRLGTHQNVVQLLGCCTEKEPCLLIMEYVMYGKMLTYLRDHRTRRDYYNFSDDAATLTSRDLTVFAYCVARGMEYLASKGILHRDLAARNILVDHNKLCKISDFGMSRYSPTGEIKEPRQPKNALPVRWMATESLLYSLFTEKTDVWSFGILLWEIVTLGATPYATMSGREVMHCVCDGYRLERPSHCKPEIYRLMERTWLSDPNSRPSFSELRHEIAELLENNSIDYSYVDLESFAADSNIYEITNVNSRGNYCTVKSRISEFECDI